MSTPEAGSFDKLSHFFRRHIRFVLVVVALLVAVHLLDLPFAPTTQRLEIVKSSYDWSQWQPHHPVEALEPLPTAKPLRLPPIQHVATAPPRFDIALQEKRRDEVRRVLAKAWGNYKEFAWLRDELKPQTGGAKDTFGGWAATMIDALDTLWLMGMKREFKEAVQAVVTIDWAAYKGTSCNMFETTIRHLGGILSAYDLSKEPALLEKAVELGDMLYAGFDTPNHLNPFWLHFDKAKNGKLKADKQQSAASVASLSMEFTRLAQLSQNDKYYDAIARVTNHLHGTQNLTKLPGLWPMSFDVLSGVFTHDNTFTLGAQSDSVYEYLLKMHILLGGSEPKYQEMYLRAANTTRDNLLFRPMTPKNLDILFPGTYRVGNDPPLSTEGQHLSCFTGGMYALGGKVFGLPEHVELGAKLTNGCIWAYHAFPAGIMPETFELTKCDLLSGCKWNEQKWLDTINTNPERLDRLPKGFKNVRDPSYILRPEAIESVFIMYRITGYEEYREAAWKMFESIQNATDTKYGNSAIADVTKVSTSKTDRMESFWLAETLKYFYLIFSPPDLMSLDEYVLNTEAHPFRIPKG